MTDVVIAVPEHPDINAHKIVLAAASPFFQTMFQSGMRESTSNRVEMPQIKYETALSLVEFAYCGKYGITAENAQNLLEAADCYQFHMLKENCESFLLSTIDLSNCFTLLKIADFRVLPRLSSAALTFALKNFSLITKSPAFTELSFTVLQNYLTDDELVCNNEEGVYSAIVYWLNHKKEERSQHASQLLKCVRLGRVNPRFIWDVIEKEPLFSDAECLQYINNANKYKMLGSSDRFNEFESIGRPRICSGITPALVFVGGISGNKKLNEVFALPKPQEKLQNYDLKTEWVKLPNITSDHLNLHSYSVCENENNIYITGGHCTKANHGSTSDLVSTYRAGAHDWTNLPNMLSARERHGSAFVDGSLYVVGGLMAGKQKKRPSVLCNVERYDPKYMLWSKVADLPKRCYSPGVISYKGKLHVIGGVSMVDNAKTRVSSGGTANITTADNSIASQMNSLATELMEPAPLRDDLGGPHDLMFLIGAEIIEASGQNVRRNAAGPSRTQGTAGNSSGSSTSKQNSTKAELEYVQIYCPRKDEWTIHHIGRKLARLACALYKDYVYVVSNNSKAIFRYCPNTCVLEEWLVIDRLNRKLEFAGFIAYGGKLLITGGQRGDETLDDVTIIDIETKKVDSKAFGLPKAMCMHGCVLIEQHLKTLENAFVKAPVQTSASTINRHIFARAQAQGFAPLNQQGADGQHRF